MLRGEQFIISPFSLLSFPRTLVDLPISNILPKKTCEYAFVVGRKVGDLTFSSASDGTGSILVRHFFLPMFL
jgi:hypothetical protein